MDAARASCWCVLEIIYSITDPPIVFIRRFVPPLRLGAIALDTSFIIVLISCYLLLSSTAWSSSAERRTTAQAVR